MGLLPSSLTPRLAEDVALVGSWLPFRPAADLIAHFRGVEVSEATLRRFTERAGQAYVESQTEEEEALESELPEAPPGPALQQLSVDGAMVPLLHGEWAEVKTLAIGTIKESEVGGEVHAGELSYFSRMTDHQRFGRLATVETHRRGTETAGTVCAVVDGAEWQQKFIDLHRPDAVRILDWCHAAGHLAQAGQAAYGGGSAEHSEWLGVQLHQLKHGEPEEVLGNLRRLRQELEQRGCRTEDGVKAVEGCLEYLEKRRGQIRYAEFQSQGYPIGSGAVESANKLVVEARLKGSGMHWASKNVDPMLAMRTVVCGDRWKEAWPKINRKLRNKAGKGRRAQSRAPGELAERDAPSPKTGLEARRPAQPTPQNPQPTRGQDRPSHPTSHRPAPDHPWRRMSVGNKPTRQPTAKS